jgi:hypothetical protein
VEDLLVQACKKLHFSNSLIANAKKIKAKNNLDFFFFFFNSEIAERDLR